MAVESGQESDPLVAFTFGLEIDNLSMGFFTEVGGLGSENDVVAHEVVDGSGHEQTKKIPGRLKWEDISLKRGITGDMAIWDWRQQVEEGNMTDARRNGSVIMYDRDYTEVARWNFENAWPSKVTGPTLDAKSTDIGVEEITIVHEGIDRVT